MPLYCRAVLAGRATLPFLRAPAHAARSPGTLTFGLSSYSPNLHPWINAGTAAGTVAVLHYRGLMSFAPDGSIQPELAVHWERDGENGWVFKLRDAVFHNRKPVTSADVKWSFEQIAAPTSSAYMRAQFQSAQSIETPDGHTVRLIMKEPVVTVPEWLATFYVPIVAAGTGTSDELPVGCGPFVLKSYERGVRLKTVAFDKYYKLDYPS
jgi:ABC-type transport system substrate-binding protein